MKRFDFVKRIFAFIVAAGLCGGLLWAQAKDEAKPSRVVVQEGQDSQATAKLPRAYDFSYTLGFEYDYLFDMPHYSDIAFYKTWQEDMLKLSDSLFDVPGTKGHLFKIANAFEWRWNAFSLSAFANVTLNYLPAFFDTALNCVPVCWNAAMRCFKICGSIMNWAFSEGWLLINACTLFAMPTAAVLVVGICGAVCLVAVPCSVLFVALPMFDLGGSMDYHPFTNENVDTKLSLGLNIDGYRLFWHAGIAGLYTQAEASFKFNHFKLYAQAGYRFDIMNIAGSIKTAGGNPPRGGEVKYVPAPYVKAGFAYRF